MRALGKARDYKAEHERRLLVSPNYRRKQRVAVYGLSLAEFEAIWLKHKGKCAICGFIPKPGEHALCLDHCHKTNRIRGLLCHWCNIGLGRFKDSPKLLRVAISYLTKKLHYGIIKKKPRKAK